MSINIRGFLKEVEQIADPAARWRRIVSIGRQAQDERRLILKRLEERGRLAKGVVVESLSSLMDEGKLEVITGLAVILLVADIPIQAVLMKASFATLSLPTALLLGAAFAVFIGMIGEGAVFLATEDRSRPQRGIQKALWLACGTGLVSLVAGSILLYARSATEVSAEFVSVTNAALWTLSEGMGLTAGFLGAARRIYRMATKVRKEEDELRETLGELTRFEAQLGDELVRAREELERRQSQGAGEEKVEPEDVFTRYERELSGLEKQLQLGSSRDMPISRTIGRSIGRSVSVGTTTTKPGEVAEFAVPVRPRRGRPPKNQKNETPEKGSGTGGGPFAAAGLLLCLGLGLTQPAWAGDQVCAILIDETASVSEAGRSEAAKDVQGTLGALVDALGCTSLRLGFFSDAASFTRYAADLAVPQVPREIDCTQAPLEAKGSLPVLMNMGSVEKALRRQARAGCEERQQHNRAAFVMKRRAFLATAGEKMTLPAAFVKNDTCLFDLVNYLLVEKTLPIIISDLEENCAQVALKKAAPRPGAAVFLVVPSAGIVRQQSQAALERVAAWQRYLPEAKVVPYPAVATGRFWETTATELFKR